MLNVQNIGDNECYKWFLVRYLQPADYHLVRIRKIGKLFKDKLDFEDIKFSVKIKDIHKIEKNNYIDISVFGYDNKIKYLIYVSKKML